MAIWGAPLDCDNHAECAVSAAWAMLAEVAHSREAWGAPEMKIGIGIHSGEAVVGIVGAPDRCEYTAIGDTVNLASRIEGLNKQFSSQLLFSAATARLLPPSVPVRLIGEAAAKGRAQKVTVYSLESGEADTTNEP